MCELRYVYDSNNDTDEMLAYYHINNMCDYIYTLDSDMVGYGVPYINYLKWDDDYIQLVNIKKTMELHGVDFPKLQYVCVLLGTDYNT